MNTSKAPLFLAFLLIIFYTGRIKAQSTPVLAATGNQIYCLGSPMNIAGLFSINDPGLLLNGIYIQISEGYVNGQDILSLSGTNTGLTASWDAVSAKLSIRSINGQNIPHADLEAAVLNVVYSNISATPSAGIRRFSITIGEANYLPSTGHYYRFISQPFISWTSARTAAQNSTYYGRQGYLATILSPDEAQLCGEQATGTGWIGGSDAETEGIWKWVTGPEAGAIFWFGGANGSTPNFAFWNNGEPNNAGDEDYAHVTAPGVGIRGSWNDLPNNGSTGVYEPKGYIVEYGGMPGDSPIDISASTEITVPSITSVIPASVCGQGTVTLQASGNNTPIYWYDAQSGGSALATGSSFTTPVLTATTTYYVSAFAAGCNANRTAVTATVNNIPVVTPISPITLCGEGTVQLEAAATAGTINWYDAPSGGTLIGSGNTITSPVITGNTAFYAEAVHNNCISLREAVTVNFFPAFEVSDERVVFCTGNKVILDAGLTDVDYEWPGGEATQTIEVSEAGTYDVILTNASGCVAVKTFTVTALPSPVIEVVMVNSDRATIVVAGNDQDNYEYSLNGIDYQSSNTFVNLSAGSYIAYIKSGNGCGLDFKEFTVFLIPKFFTPNNDSVNDVFSIAGMASFPEATIDIFDRYGKLIIQLNRAQLWWDGTFNNQKLPATDYWYIIKLDDKTPEIKGHFSLIR
jgi:gliding motility-associated-like protein